MCMTLEGGYLFSIFFFAQAILLIYQFLNYFLVVFRMLNTRLGQWLNLLVCSLILLRADAIPVGITYVQNAVAKGAGNTNSDCSLIFLFSNFPRSYSFIFAFILQPYSFISTVCLDGSPPAYHFSPGFGSGINNWLVQIEVCFFSGRTYQFLN